MPLTANKKANGRPRKIRPTEEDKQRVADLSGYGVPQEQIAATVCGGMGTTALRRYFPDEILEGQARINEKVGQSLAQRAMSGKDTIASIFWAKTRMKWREVQRHEVGGPDGGPVQISAIELTVVDPKPKAKSK